MCVCVCVYTYEYSRFRGGQMGGDDVEADVTTSVLKGEGKHRKTEGAILILEVKKKPYDNMI